MLKLFLILLTAAVLFIYIPENIRTDIVHTVKQVINSVEENFNDALDDVYTPNPELRNTDKAYDEVSNLLEETRKLRHKLSQN